jgi:hypothetical protein
MYKAATHKMDEMMHEYAIHNFNPIPVITNPTNLFSLKSKTRPVEPFSFKSDGF